MTEFTIISDYRWDENTSENHIGGPKLRKAESQSRVLEWSDLSGESFGSFGAPTLASTLSSGQLISSIQLPEPDTGGPIALGVADRARQFNFDATGDDDLVMMRRSDGQLIIGVSNGTYAVYSASVANSRLMWAADFSGDGVTDFLWLNNANNIATLQVTNPGSVPSVASTLTGSIGNTTRSIAGYGDFNADGITDLIMRSGSTTAVEILYNTGTTLFNSTVNMGNVGFNFALEGTGDLNGDGFDDLIWRDTNGIMSAWLMNGTSTYALASLPTVGHEWRLENIGRLNNDGKADFLWRNTITGRVLSWITGGTSSTITQSAVLDYGTAGMDLEFHTVRYGQHSGGNGGGNPKIIWQRTDFDAVIQTLNANGSLNTELRLRVELDDNDFIRNRPYQAFDFSARRMTPTGDFTEASRTNTFGTLANGQGVVPIFDSSTAFNGQSFMLEMTLTSGALNIVSATGTVGGGYGVSRQLVGVATGDFNNDGVSSDLLYRNILTGGLSVSLRTSTGYTSPTNYNSNIGRSWTIGSGKMRPGSADTFVNISGTGQILLTNFSTSNGSIVSLSTVNGPVVGPNMIGQGLADLDGNGKKDIVFRHADTGAISYYNFDGDTYLGQLLINTTPVTLEWDLLGFADLNGDGDDDIVWRHNGNGNVVSWNMQAGGIGSVDYLGNVSFQNRFIGTSDLNNDGKGDLIWQNSSGVYTAWLMNGFTTIATAQSSAQTFDKLALGSHQATMRSM
jgi:hypothetical protein